MKIAMLVGGAAGSLLLIGLAVHTDLPAMLGALKSGGWRLAWLLPYRSLFFGLYALGWLILLRSAYPRCSIPFSYLFWVTSVREAVDRLLPVASVGGSFVGVRLLRWQGLDTAVVGSTIIAEIVLTMTASYIFAAAGLALLTGVGSVHKEVREVLTTLSLSLPVPLAAAVLLRYGSVFERLQKIVRNLSGLKISVDGAASLDHQVRSMFRNRSSLFLAGILELSAVVSGCFEIWFAMRLFGHTMTVADAIILESITGAVRHIAFIVPGAIGVQEAGLVVFGQALGIDSEFMLAASMVKRARELVWGIPALFSWQLREGRHLARA